MEEREQAGKKGALRVRRITFFLQLVLFPSPLLLAQEGLTEEAGYYHEGKNVLVAFQAYFAQHFSQAQFEDSLCVESCTFVKFRVDAQGEIKYVQCTIETPPLLAAALVETVRSTSGKWTPRRVNGKAVESQDYLWPVYYVLGRDGCDNKQYEAMKGLLLMLQFEGQYDGRTSTIINRYRSGQSLDCIVLHPFIVMPPEICGWSEFNTEEERERYQQWLKNQLPDRHK